MQNELIKQYAGKVSALCPPEEREEIEKRVMELISSKAKDASGAESNVQSVLDQCGSPEIMAELLKNQGQECPIRGTEYRKYLKALKIFLAIMTFLMIFSSVINIICTHETGMTAVWDVISSLMSGDSIMFTTVTLFFVLFRKKGK